MDKNCLTSQEKTLLKFMESTIQKVTQCMSGLYTIQNIMIEKGIITKNELRKRLKEDQDRPKRALGIETLEKMIKEYNNN